MDIKAPIAGVIFPSPPALVSPTPEKSNSSESSELETASVRQPHLLRDILNNSVNHLIVIVDHYSILLVILNLVARDVVFCY